MLIGRPLREYFRRLKARDFDRPRGGQLICSCSYSFKLFYLGG